MFDIQLFDAVPMSFNCSAWPPPIFEPYTGNCKLDGRIYDLGVFSYTQLSLNFKPQ